jgi:sugar lactone lactonase YvrE
MPRWFRIGLTLTIFAVLPLSFAAIVEAQSPTTWYVRPDGGSPAQCTGRVNAPYPGSGTNQPCAWDHPFRALPPGGTPRIAGGDTLIIGTGAYMMGYGAPGADNCASAYPWDCYMPPIPSGPNPSTPTRILGAGWDTGTPSPPQLWGTERAYLILNLTDSSNVEINYLEITDHSGCVEFHTGGLACKRDAYPFGPWAAIGLYAEDSANVVLRNLDIHGLAAGGIHAGRLTDWTVDNVRLAGNGWVGWDGDIDGTDSNAGTLRFHRWTVEWNGCGETYPGGQPTGCWAQTAGGYGDGVGTGATGGHWIIEDSKFLHNTSDGLDLLYARIPGSSIEIRRTRAEGNAGNQIKTTGPTLIENSIIVGNCGYFHGQPFTYNVDDCRAYGNAIDVTLRPGDRVTVTNSTFTSEGDCLVGAGADGTPNGSEAIILRNDIFQGQTDFLQPFENTCLVYQETFPRDPFDVTYALINNVKHNACPGSNNLCGVPPGLVNTGIDTFDAHLLANSPAINAGATNGAPSDDFDGNARDAQPDIGAYEYGSTVTSTPTPTSNADFTVTPTPTSTSTRASTSTRTRTPTITRRPTRTRIPTRTPTPTRTPRFTRTSTRTRTPTVTATTTSGGGAHYVFVTAWGSNGSGNGQFGQTSAVALDRDGNVLVGDYYGDRVQRFTPAGSFLNAFGSFGTAPGEMWHPVGIAVNASGQIYVVEDENHRVQRFASDGTFELAFGSYGSGNGQLFMPNGIALDANGNVYVADTGNRRIEKFSPSGNYLAQWGTRGIGDNQFESPYGIAINASAGWVYVADRDNHRIQKFDLSGNFLGKWGAFGSGTGQFNEPSALWVDNPHKNLNGVVDASGNVFVADSGNARIQKFNANGVFLTAFGSSGSAPGQFNAPDDVVVDASGNVYVSDSGNSRVQKFAVQ